MSTEHREPDHDLEWAEKRWARRDRAEPPELLDQAVLNAARRALPEPRKSRRLPWISGLATAGVVVLALGLLLRQEPSQPVRLDTPSLSPSTSAPAQESVPAPVTERMLQRSHDAPSESRLEMAEAESDFVDEDKKASESPEAWIDRLRILHEAGDWVQYEHELEAFRAVYPDMALPPELVRE